MRSVIYTIYKDSITNDGDIINARFYINNLNGEYIDGYKIENATILKRLTFTNKTELGNKNRAQSKAPLQEPPPDSEEDQSGGGGCWNTDNLPDGLTLNTVWMKTVSSSGSGISGSYGGIIGSTRGSYSTTSTSNGIVSSGFGFGAGGGIGGSGGNSYEGTPAKLTAKEIKVLAGAIVVSPIPTPDPILAPEKIIIDTTFINSKANCVYELLGKQDGIKSILSKLTPENSTYKLILEVKRDLKNLKGEKVSGLTTGSYDPGFSEIKIQIDQDIANTASFPYLATTIVHEAIHAKLFEMVKSVGGLDKLKDYTNEATEFGKLWAYYDEYGKSKGWQHELMYGNYLSIIGDAVENFHKTFYIEDYNSFHKNMVGFEGYNKNTFYQEIASYGLRNTTKFPKGQMTIVTLLVENLRNNSKAKNCLK